VNHPEDHLRGGGASLDASANFAAFFAPSQPAIGLTQEPLARVLPGLSRSASGVRQLLRYAAMANSVFPKFKWASPLFEFNRNGLLKSIIASNGFSSAIKGQPLKIA